MFNGIKTNKFEVNVLIHLDAGYNLARWMMSDESEAKDVVQTAALRALIYVDSMRPDEAKAWFMGIIRNCCLSALSARNKQGKNVDFDALVDGNDELETLGASSQIPEQMLMTQESRALVNQTLVELPVIYREVLILREMEDLSYEQIGAMVGVPVGTVMSRLSRARLSFREAFMRMSNGESS